MDIIQPKMVRKGPAYPVCLTLSKESDMRRGLYAVDKIKNNRFPAIKHVIVLTAASDPTSRFGCTEVIKRETISQLITKMTNKKAAKFLSIK